jgi:hypothetical protein
MSRVNGGLFNIELVGTHEGTEFRRCCLSFLSQVTVDTFPIQIVPNNLNLCNTGVLTTVTMKNAVFWDVTPCSSCKNPSLGGIYRHHHYGDNNDMMMEAILK